MTIMLNDVKAQVREELDKINSEYRGISGKLETTSFLLRAKSSLEGSTIIDESGKDRTEEFLKSLDNIMMDPLSRDPSYELHPMDRAKIYSVSRGYTRIPVTKLPTSVAYTIHYVPTGEEVGRCLLTVSGELPEVYVEYLELNNTVHRNIYYSDIFNDLIPMEYGINAKLIYSKDVQGILYA